MRDPDLFFTFFALWPVLSAAFAIVFYGRFDVHVSSLGVNKPVVLGEFPADGARRHPTGVSPPERTIEEYLEFALASGYSGAWPWSFSGTDDYGALPEAALLEFAKRHEGLVNPRCLAKSS